MARKAPLAALQEAPPPSAAAQPLYLILPVDAIEVRGNVRRTFDERALAELAESIRAHGVLEPLVVRTDPRAPLADVAFVERNRDHNGDVLETPGAGRHRWSWVLVAGERRLRAAKLAGLREVPVIVRDLDEAASARIQLLENLQRQDLDPIEEAEAYRELIEDHGVRQADLARELGVSDGHISNRRRLLRLPAGVLDEISHGKLSPSVAMSLVNLDAPADLVARLAATLVEEGVTQAQAPKRVAHLLSQWCPRVDDARAYGSRSDATCDPAAHRQCPCRRTCELPWGAKAAVCVDPDRFHEVEAEALRRLEERAKAALAKAGVPEGAAGGREVVDYSKLGYGHYEHVHGGTPEEPPAAHAACPCLRLGRYGASGPLQWICVDPKRHRAEQVKASRARNRAEREALATENERIRAWAQELAERTAGSATRYVPLGSTELAYLAAFVLAHTQPEAVAGGTTPRVERDKYLRDRLGFTPEELKREYVEALASRPPLVLWRTCVEWPALCVGERVRSWHHGPFAWYRRQVDGAADPDPEDEEADKEAAVDA